VIKDRGQKDMLYKHFRAQGWMAQVEVPLSTPHGVSSNSPPITDIDVLGIRPSANLEWDYIIGDCKTKRRESPVNRVLWVRGLQEAVRASGSIVLLKREPGSKIERDHKMFAERLDTTLIEEQEFYEYDRAVLYPHGSARYPEDLAGLEELREGLIQKFPALRAFVQWIMSEAWLQVDHATLLRRIIAHGRDVRGELDPRRDDHLALIFEFAGAFAIPFATIVGMIFRRHLQPDDRDDLDDAIRVIIWGGRERYDFFNTLRRELAAARGRSVNDDLALPNWELFLEILRSYLEAPHLAFRTPQLLRGLAIAVVQNRVSEFLTSVDDKMLLHLAQRLAVYVVRAAEYPADASSRIKETLLPRISKLTVGARQPDIEPAQLMFPVSDG
jgi:hypothetical protein